MVKIRLLQKEDIKKIVYLEESFLGETLGEEMLESELDSKVTKFYVATLNDEIVGYIGRYEFLGEAEILNFVVDETYQRQGIGRKIVNHLLEHIRESGMPGTLVSVGGVSVKGKEPFYEKMGFRILSTGINQYLQL